MNVFVKKISKYYKQLDKWLLIAVTFCSLVGVLLLYSMCTTGASDITPRYYWIQLVSTGLGVCVCLLIASLDYHHFIKLWFIYAPPAVALVLLTFTGLGLQRAGADDRAWLNLGFTTLQPSEFLKLAFILTFAFHLSKDAENINHPLHLLLIIVHGAVPVGLVALQGAGLSIKYIIAAILVTPPAMYLIWNYGLQSLHKKRILVLIHPGTDPMGLEYQQNLGLAALGSGGLFGKGLFTKDYVTVPEMHNDFIFSYLGQVLGFVGAIAAVVVLAYICIKILNDSRNTMDLMGKLICLGTFAMIFTHCFMNIGMVLKVMPVIGIPLPFFSAGGSSAACLYLGVGLVQSVFMQKNDNNVVEEF